MKKKTKKLLELNKTIITNLQNAEKIFGGNETLDGDDGSVTLGSDEDEDDDAISTILDL